jgi:hypothetical protein
VIIAGPVMGENLRLDGEEFLNIVRRVARSRVTLLDVPDERVVVSRFGLNAPLTGAASIALGKFFNDAASHRLLLGVGLRQSLETSRATSAPVATRDDLIAG